MPAKDAAAAQRRAWITLGILILTSLVGFIDRQVLSFMVGPIKHDLGLTDVQISLLQGFAFAAFYSVAAIPIGMLMDRTHRLRLLSLGIFLWSLMTAAGGFASSFAQLFAARVGVGVGEATLGPAAHSLIADHFPRERLPLAMSVYGLGVALGVGLGYAAGGALVHHFVENGTDAVPFFDGLRPWQAVFVVVGLPGLVMLPLLLFVAHEPARVVHAHESALHVASMIWQRRGAFLPLIGAACCMTANSFAALNWAPELLHRQWAMNAQDAGKLLGVLMVVGPLPGGLLCGVLAGRLVRRGDSTGPLLVMAACAVIGAPFILVACAAHTPHLAFAAVLVPVVLGQSYVGLAPASVQGLTPQKLRAQAAAVYLLCTSLIGASIGPFMVALISEHVLGGEQHLGLALGLTASGFSLLGGMLMFLARAPYRRLAAADAAQNEARKVA